MIITHPDSSIGHFNTLSRDDARSMLASCLDVPRWVAEVEAGRPYADAEQVLTMARSSAARLTSAEVDGALSRHPRIGERAGEEHDAEFSQAEQSGVDGSDESSAQALAAGNAAYEERFGRVFLIRAAGRSAPEILAELDRRLKNDPATERAEVVGQLGEIAILRLRQLVGA